MPICPCCEESGIQIELIRVMEDAEGNKVAPYLTCQTCGYVVDVDAEPLEVNDF